jgi:protein involved in polysaccharide export with SLBB domain
MPNKARILRVFSSALLSLSLAADAFDLGDLKNAGRSDFSDFAGLKDPGSSESFSSLPGDVTPFVGDFPVIDSLYMVGPGDRFQIFYESNSIEKQVNPEGNIILSRTGILKLEGLNLKVAKRLILEKIQSVHKRNECFVNLAFPKSMKVFVTGGVVAPGGYQIAGNLRLSDVLALARGFSQSAQKDSVYIVDADGARKGINISRFLIDGDLESNPYLAQGAIIHVPLIDMNQPWVSVRRDSAVLNLPLRPNENLHDILFKFHSFNSPPTFSRIVVKEKSGREAVLTSGEMAGYRPESEAKIEIMPLRWEIYVGGAVLRPGYQLYRSDFKMAQYISEAGITTSSKISSKMEITHSDGTRETVAIKDAIPRPGDMIYVDQNVEQRLIIYTPILLSLVSLMMAFFTVTNL